MFYFSIKKIIKIFTLKQLLSISEIDFVVLSSGTTFHLAVA